jgi:cell division protein FtsW
MVFSTAAVQAIGSPGGVFFHLKRQMLATGLGAAALMLTAALPLPRMARYGTTALAVTGALMLAVFVHGVGKCVGGATRWINLGFISFQPVEVFKVAVVLCYARLLTSMPSRQDWPARSWAVIVGLAIGSVILPVMQRDFGSAFLMLILGGAMIWLAGVRTPYLAGFGAAAATAVTLLITSEPYRMQRIKLYLSAWLSADGGGYQTKQSLIALGAGGLFGVGLGEGGQKLFYLPSAHADFIYAIIGEELGFAGAMAVLALYVLFLRSGFSIARQSSSRFARLLAAGITLLIFCQAMWHIAVAVVLVPTKGLALPFVSYGGSSLMSSMLAVGILLRCAAEPAGSRTARGERSWAPL